ncbi:hypothetical protein D3C80_1614360 [compost metagenome]
MMCINIILYNNLLILVGMGRCHHSIKITLIAQQTLHLLLGSTDTTFIKNNWFFRNAGTDLEVGRIFLELFIAQVVQPYFEGECTQEISIVLLNNYTFQGIF